MTFSLPILKAACAVCPIGSASHVVEGGSCPMSDKRRAAGALLYSAGQPADAIYYLKHGSVALSRGDAIDAAPYAVRRAGSLLGLEAIVRPTFLDSARAISDVTVCATSRAEMLAWLHEKGTARVVLDSVLGTLAADSPSRATTDGSAPQRIARWLLDEKHPRRLPRSVLAGLLGMKPETLSRGLAALSHAEAVTATRTRLEVRDAAKLERIASGEEHVAPAPPSRRSRARATST